MKDIKSWEDITIGQYQEMMTVNTDNGTTKFIEWCSISLDVDPQDIRDLSLSEYKDLNERLYFLSGEPSRDYKFKFELDGVQYGMIPDMKCVTAGEFIDAESWKENAIENMHNLVALIWRPIKEIKGDDWIIEPHISSGFTKRAELFREKISIEWVLGAIFFFIQSEMRLLTAFLDYSVEEMKEETK